MAEIKFDYKDKVRAGNMQFFGDNTCAFKIIGDDGKPQNSDGIINFLPAKYKEKHKGKNYDFSRFTSDDGIANNELISNKGNSKRFNPKNVNFNNSETDETDPVQANPSSKYLFNNEDAIVVKFKKETD